MEDMLRIRLAVEGMKAEIVKAFDAKQISQAIRMAADKAVDDFDMETFIKETVDCVFRQSREIAIAELSDKYGNRWSEDLSRMIDEKTEQALKDKNNKKD